METFSALLAIVLGIHRSPVNSPYKGPWRGALMFSLIGARINDWVNNREAGDLIRRLAHYDVTVMQKTNQHLIWQSYHCCHPFDLGRYIAVAIPCWAVLGPHIITTINFLMNTTQTCVIIVQFVCFVLAVWHESILKCYMSFENWVWKKFWWNLDATSIK